MDERKVTAKFYKGLGNPDIMDIRTEVFVDEQGFKDEFDEYDARSIHVLIYKDKESVATGRFYIEDGKAHLGRIAVRKDYRQQGFGRLVIEKLEEKALKEGIKETYLYSQADKAEFYMACGYSRSDDKVYLDQDYPHYKMHKRL